MKWIKDFLYDKNDILIALLILVAAALIILWRMDVIMAYPQTVFANGSDADVSAAASELNVNDQQSGEGQSSQPDGGTTDAGSDGNPAAGALWTGGTLSRDVEVNVTGSTAAAAIDCLVQAGLFEDYAEYQQICQESGLDHEKVSAGVLTFEKGSTKKDVARKINWS